AFGRTRSRLWKGGRHGSVEHYVAFHLLHDLVNMSVQHSDRAKALEKAEGLRTVLGAPAPVRIDGPQRDIRKHNDRPAGGVALELRFVVLERLVAELTEAVESGDVRQPDEVEVLVIEADPPAALSVFAVPSQELLPVIDGRVMLPRYEEDLLWIAPFQQFVEHVIFAGLRRVTQVACVNDELGLLRQRVDLVDGRLQRGADIGVSWFVEAYVGIA